MPGGKMPDAFKNLPDSVKQKAMDIFNALLKDGMDEGKAISIAISRAKKAVKEGEEVSETIEELEAPSTAKLSESFKLEESLDETGRKWRVVLIRPGWSANNTFYSTSVLESGASMFEGAKAFAASGEDHSEYERGVRSVAGWFEDVSFTEQGLEATFFCADSDIRNLLNEAWRAGKQDLLGFSIRAEAELRPGTQEGKSGLIVDRFLEGLSVDVVMNPAAGGRILQLLESKQEETMEEEKVSEETETEIITKESITNMISEALKKELEVQEEEEKTSEANEVSEAVKVAEAELTAIREARQSLQDQVIEQTINATDLPDVAKSRLRSQFLGKPLKSEQLQEAVVQERDYLAAVTPSNPIGYGVVKEGADSQDKYIARLDATFEGRPIKVGDEIIHPFGSLREAYYQFTGDNPYTSDSSRGLWDSLFCNYHNQRTQLKESLATGDWGEVFANRLNKKLLDEYNETSNNFWQAIVSDRTSLQNLEHAQRRVRVGGYANLPTVSQQANYTEATSPTDEEVTYSPSKYGILDSITWEMILADDLGAIRRIPTGLARSMRRTQNEFFFNFIEDNPTIYDGNTLFDNSNHGGNTNTTSGLNLANIATGWQVMRSQTAYNETAFVLGTANLPKILVVPNELEGIANKIAGPTSHVMVDIATDTNNDEDPGRFRGKFEVIVADWFTDNNDWFLIADPRLVPTIEAGFLNGRDEPELWVQDNPTSGSVFTSDKITYKIRHVWGGAVLDYRSFYRGQG
jgi:hypothetical protein